MIEYENLRKVNEPFYEDYIKTFQSVLKSGWFVLGQQVKDFEQNFAAYCGTKYCIGTANGLDALTICLKALDFKEGQEVIVPSNTYIATILSILNCKLKPVLVEPDIRTYNLDPTLIEEAISSNTVAIMVVHLYGKCCDMEAIQAISKKHNLSIVEDCAQAHGAMFKGQKAGAFGDLSAFSFYPTKNLGALGDGGSINTNSQRLDEITRKFRNYGSNKKYHNDLIGVNSRLDEIQAAFLNQKLKRLHEINDHKRRLAFLYQKNLKSDFVKPQIHPDYHDVYHIYNIRHPRRNELKEYLLHKGIGSEIHYPVPPHRQNAMMGILDHYALPVSEEIHNTTLSLPISFFHKISDIEKIIEVMNEF